MSNGSFTIQGQQNNITPGPVNIGPFSVQCSAESYIQPIPLTAGTNTFTIPTTPKFSGVFLLTPLASGHTSIKYGGAAATIFVTPTSGISLITFDPNNYPASIVVTTVGNATSPSFLQFF